MPLFYYTAKTKESRTVRTIEEASTREELVGRLHSQGLTVISVEEKTMSVKKPRSDGMSSGKKSAHEDRRKHNRVTLLDLSFFARNIAITLASGMPLLRSLDLSAQQSESSRLSTVLRDISESVREGLSLHESIAKHPKVFSPLWRGIVEVGEASGNLPLVLEKLADYAEMSLEYQRKIKGALIYPVMVSIFAVIAMGVFFGVILPKFSEIFTQFNIELPLLTQILFNISNFVVHYFLWIILVFVAGIVGFIHFKKTSVGTRLWDKTLLTVPVVQNVVLVAMLERLTSTLYILLENGVPLVYSLDVVSKSMGNSVIEEYMASVKEGVKKGQDLSSQLAKFRILPPLLSEVTRIGEETGELSVMFQRLSDYYRKELTSNLEQLMALFEPVMIFVLGTGIGTVVIALFLPMFKLSSLG